MCAPGWSSAGGCRPRHALLPPTACPHGSSLLQGEGGMNKEANAVESREQLDGWLSASEYLPLGHLHALLKPKANSQQVAPI